MGAYQIAKAPLLFCRNASRHGSRSQKSAMNLLGVLMSVGRWPVDLLECIDIDVHYFMPTSYNL